MSAVLRTLALVLALTIAVPAFGALVEPRQLNESQFTVYYWPGDEAIAQETLDVLQRGVKDLAARLPVGPEKISVTVCRSLSEFRAVAGRYGQAWVGGVTHSDSGSIAVKAPYILPQRQEYAGILRHELIHVLLARNTKEANLPRWFNEGVAMLVSGEFRWSAPARVARMYASGRLIQYRNLDFALMDAGDEMLSTEAYAQALSMARFIRDRIGEEKFWGLVHAMRETPFEKALVQATGLTQAALYERWHASLWKTAIITAAASAFSVFDLMILLAVLVYIRKRRRNQVILQHWVDEELEALVDGPPWEPYVSPPPEWDEEEDED